MPNRSNISKIPLEPRASSRSIKIQTTMSSWTPLNHLPSNNKFDRWSDSQRRAVLQDFVQSCSMNQLMFLSQHVSRQLPLQAADFTCLLPRVLSLFLFSFLDPRSLCRCAQVSWHWKSIVELDQLWMPKCERLGWCIPFSPTPFEQGAWKRHYINTVQELRLTSLKTTLLQQQLIHVHVPHAPDTSCRHEEPSALTSDSIQQSQSSSQHPRPPSRRKQPTEPPPWRDSDRCPKDTLRFNYLDNMDPTEQTFSVHARVRASSCCTKTRSSADVSKRSISEGSYKLRKAKSLMFLSSNSRPPPPPESGAGPWAAHSHEPPVMEESTRSMVGLAQWNVGIYPRPVRITAPRLSVAALRAPQRSQRSVPSK